MGEKAIVDILAIAVFTSGLTELEQQTSKTVPI